MIRVKLIQPDVSLKRTEDGFYRHPDLPVFDEGDIKKVDEWESDQGIEQVHYLYMFDDLPQRLVEKAHSGFDGYMELLPQWTPNPPAGFGWFLIEITDTYDDGPVAVFVRRQDGIDRDIYLSIRNMSIYGGSFAKKLSELWGVADDKNKEAIKETWGDLLERYKSMGKGAGE